MSKVPTEIDFVIAWVDGNDPEWKMERQKYKPSGSADSTEVRYRDWDNLIYWFRGVEQYAPWVRKIHFVTWGHIPPWLNTQHPKLNIVMHKDYIPQTYLPTFNSHTIELNLHKIKDLSECFVFFNDDMFLLEPTKPTDFFKDGLPRDMFSLDAIYFGENGIGHINGNNMEVINRLFNKGKVIRKNALKIFSLSYGIKRLIKTICLLPWPWFAGIYYQHLPVAYRKSSFQAMWAEAEDRLDSTCRCRFRDNSNVNQWVIKYWQLCSGLFAPGRSGKCKCFHMRENNYKNIVETIDRSPLKIVCVNDTSNLESFTEAKNLLTNIFEKKFGRQSSYEK